MHHDIQLFAEYAVTPFVGVWIETNSGFTREFLAMSHPSWVCGLKHEPRKDQGSGHRVTPFVGVWIETFTDFPSITNTLSHPSWVCGLKQRIPLDNMKHL